MYLLKHSTYRLLHCVNSYLALISPFSENQLHSAQTYL